VGSRRQREVIVAVKRFLISLEVSLFAKDTADARELGDLLVFELNKATGHGQTIIRLVEVEEE
jgi:hypothetical protein